MANYDNLLREMPIPVDDNSDLPDGRKGFYVEAIIESKLVQVILLDPKKIRSRKEKTCVLAEEAGHHYKTSGDISDQSIISNRRQERLARIWAHEKLVPLTKVVEAHKAGVRNRHEFAEYLQVTEEFLQEALDKYREKYGLCVRVNGHNLSLDPLGIIEFFE